MRIGYPIAPVVQLARSGALVGIGVDGGAANDSGSYLNELRIALLLHRVAGTSNSSEPSDWLGPGEILTMATSTASAILGRDDIGKLEAGRAADIAIFGLNKVGYAGASLNPLSALLMAGDGSFADYTIVNGRVVVEGGQLVSINEEALVDKANQFAEELVVKATAQTGIDYGKQHYSDWIS
jgi:cytosine/adenosine deaminase-related metal-dependent hydrolase